MEQFKNLATTTLAGSVTTGDSSITVTSSTGFPTSGNYRIVIDSEILLVTGVSSNTWTVTRGAEGTTAAEHSATSTVAHVLTAASLALAIQQKALCWKGAWDSGTTYAVNDVVMSGTVCYVSLTTSTNAQPWSSPSYWQPIGGNLAWRGDWYSYNNYFVNDVVQYGSPASTFVCYSNSSAGIYPTNATYWKTIGGGSSGSGPWSSGSGSESAVLTGNDNVASAGGAVAEGGSTTASGACAHAEGFRTVASGQNSHAEGSDTLATGLAAHSECGALEASGIASHAEGVLTTASGDYSHAEGQSTIASGVASHASGLRSNARRVGECAISGGSIGNSATKPQQASIWHKSYQTADNSTTQITFPLYVQEAYNFVVSVVAVRSDAEGEMQSWLFKGGCICEASGTVVTTTDFGQTLENSYAGSNYTSAVLTTTSNTLVLSITGETGKTTNWSVRVDANSCYYEPVPGGSSSGGGESSIPDYYVTGNAVIGSTACGGLFTHVVGYTYNGQPYWQNAAGNLKLWWNTEWYISPDTGNTSVYTSYYGDVSSPVGGYSGGSGSSGAAVVGSIPVFSGSGDGMVSGSSAGGTYIPYGTIHDGQPVWQSAAGLFLWYWTAASAWYISPSPENFDSYLVYNSPSPTPVGTYVPGPGTGSVTIS